MRGLDCGLGIFHADQANRQSLAADVTEPVRPHVDAFVLTSHVLERSRPGIYWKRARAAVGCHRASRTTSRRAWLSGRNSWHHTLRASEGTLRALLSWGEHDNADGADALHESRSHQGPHRGHCARCIACRGAHSPDRRAVNACRACGAKVTVRKRVYCNACFPEQMAAQRAAITPTFRQAGPAKIAAMRAAGHDPTATPEARQRRAKSASKQRNAVMTWRDDGVVRQHRFQARYSAKPSALASAALSLTPWVRQSPTHRRFG
jgi:hypothetical protein